MGAFPVACFTFLVLQWSIAHGRLEKFASKEELHAQYKNRGKKAKEEKKRIKELKKAGEDVPEPEKKPLLHKDSGIDFMHNKVMFFGSGFYGTMALLTYLIVEIDEVLSFFGKIIDFTNWSISFSFQFIIDLIINSIMNIVAAFIWFRTLPDYVDVSNGWVWIVAAYLGYLGGLRFTQEKGDEAWSFLSDTLGKLVAGVKEKLTAKQ